MPRLQIRDIEIYYEVHGSGPRLFFIGGSGGDLRDKPGISDGPLIDDFEVLSFDQRGLGQTDAPDGPYSMADYGEDAAALMLRLGARPPVSGIPDDSMLRQTQKIAVYEGSTLIIHGVIDMIIPVADAEALFSACISTDKRLLKVEGAGHNNLMAVRMSQYMKAVAGLIQSASKGSAGAREEE